MSNLQAIIGVRKSGNEPFHKDGEPISGKLLSFWQWSSSELVGNALRGILAEYLVASDIGCISEVRQEWDAFDVETPEGIKVEVKSGAYLQSWEQKKYSPIQFGIKPTYGWNSETNTRTNKKMRQSDVYVFCVLAHKDKLTVDPMNISQWEFYVLGTDILDKNIPEQATISLSSLKRLNPVKVKYGEIYLTIQMVIKNKLTSRLT